MEFDNLLENERTYHGKYRKHKYHDDDRYSHDSHHARNRNYGYFNWLNILDKFRSNNKLKQFIIIAVILVLVIGVALIIVLLPLIGKLFNYIVQNGLQGVFTDIAGFLEKIWKGTGN